LIIIKKPDLNLENFGTVMEEILKSYIKTAAVHATSVL